MPGFKNLMLLTNMDADFHQIINLAQPNGPNQSATRIYVNTETAALLAAMGKMTLAHSTQPAHPDIGQIYWDGQLHVCTGTSPTTWATITLAGGSLSTLTL